MFYHVKVNGKIIIEKERVKVVWIENKKGKRIENALKLFMYQHQDTSRWRWCWLAFQVYQVTDSDSPT